MPRTVSRMSPTRIDTHRRSVLADGGQVGVAGAEYIRTPFITRSAAVHCPQALGTPVSWHG